jgi:hypothetical protein
MNNIDKLTMNYMSNKIYNELIQSEENPSDDKLVYDSEERFYKKRLYLLYKNLFKKDDIKNKSLLIEFEKFNKVAIEYLKQEDRTSIIQKELGNTKMNMDKSVSFDESVAIPNVDTNTAENIERDQLAFQNDSNIKTCTLDNYIIRTPNSYKKDPPPPPHKIKIRLKSKELQNKDVPKKKDKNKKKNNINNKYDDSEKKQDKENKT